MFFQWSFLRRRKHRCILISPVFPARAFLVVEETGEPICGATIDVWANSVLGYQLLGVTQSDGRWNKSFSRGAYLRLSSAQTGYETVGAITGNTKRWRKVVLRKKSSNGGGTQSADKNVYTGILTSMQILSYCLEFSAALFYHAFQKKSNFWSSDQVYV